MQYLFDTSAAVKYYHVESGTEKAASIFAEPNRKIRISELGLLEIQSAFAIKVRSGVLNSRDANIQRIRLMHDIAAGEIEVHSLTQGQFTRAEQLITQYSFLYRLRTLDALQLTTALDLRNQGLLDQFVVADAVLAGLASL